ncbi:MAG TPA: hypothetical protein VKQ32_22990, partial [Polyangia bacterium]|nr:hypothetical protein [Polyangia bacterium]
GIIGRDGGAAGASGAAGGAAADAGGTTDAGGAADAAWDVGFGARRSFVVTSNVQDADGGAEVAHTFTMTVDTDQHVAIIGVDGSAVVAPLQQTSAGALRVAQTLAFGVPVAAVCGGSVTYDELTFTIDGSNHLAGTGRGQLNIIDPSLSRSVDVTMFLVGVLDTEPPTFTLSAAGDLTDPWTPFWLVSSEPLPTRPTAVLLVSEGGDIMPLTIPTGMETYMTVLAKPTRLLNFGDSYVVNVATAGLTDLAGNGAPTADFDFTTRSPPPLAAADGFESITDVSFGGAEVLSGAGAPVIAGARSLYVPPADSLSSFVTQLALRVALAPGNAKIVFSYRTVNPVVGASVSYLVASVHGSIQTTELPSDSGSQTTPAMIDGTQVLLGPTLTATIFLPDDAHDEAVLARVASQPSSCGGPVPPPVPGIIIDDLRAE